MEGPSLIIKKIKKVSHGGHHGGSWKVAYADFVTAMMAFFLLMWLISMVAPEKRARVSHYFKHFSIFEKSGTTFIDLRKASPKIQVIEHEGIDADDVHEEVPKVSKQLLMIERMKTKLKEEVEKRLGDVKDQIMVDSFEGGVRIELVDKEGGHAMFPSGSPELTVDGRKILKVIAENTRDNGWRIALEGHTDAHSYTGTNFSNWELSTMRASAARRELERNGLPTERLMRVAGYAATQPLIKENPFDPRNRRISVLLFYAAGANEPLPEELDPQEANALIEKTRREPVKPVKRSADPVQNYLLFR